MRYPRDQRQAEILALAQGLAERIAPRAAEHDRAGTIPVESYDDLVAAGYHRLTVPAAYGGFGASMIEFVLAQNALARGDESVALGINMHLMSVANASTSVAWPPALYERVMHEVVSTGALLNSAAAEPELGSPAGGGRPLTTATQVEGGWLVNGRKTFTSLSPILRYYIVLATIGDKDGGVEIGQFLVRNGAGVRIEPTWDVMAMRSTASHDIVLENAFVPDSDVIARRMLGQPTPGAPGGSYFALGVGGVYLAIGESARDVALEFARTRAPTGLGKPIGTLPTIQHRIARMDVLLMAARELLFGAAQDLTDFPAERAALGPKVAAAKYLATNNAIEVVDLAMRVVGGVALFRTMPLERYYRNVRAGLSHPPIDDRAFDQIARAALGMQGSASNAGTGNP
ncbi:MAG TPA: acyl-CoA dehydrogenase family protein [Dehalococcoidia bacterium]|jgi:alkylation response protein AidB-like acyl-CoA dehydrogenase|nr:acyl-CoA dehydrogenase family protein [Dehalococcoidia bacterium]